MRLRKLEIKDAPYMLEWMHDESVVRFMRADFASKTLDHCKQFIASAQDTEKNLHLAVVDENEDYMGTVSLKNIKCQKAEFAITIRKCAMGKGYASYAMSNIIKYGFEKLDLTVIYWCVDSKNARAIRFYEKNGYTRVAPLMEAQEYNEGSDSELIWFCVTKA